MSLFRKPKKPIQRRVFSYGEEHGEDEDMSVDVSERHKSSEKDRKSERKSKDEEKSIKKNSLLSFDDEGVCVFFCA